MVKYALNGFARPSTLRWKSICHGLRHRRTFGSDRMKSKNVCPRNIAWIFLILFLTGGMFAWYYIILIFNDINKISERKIFPVRMISLLFISFGSIYLMLILLPPGLCGYAELRPNAGFYAIISIALIFVVSIYMSLLLANVYIRMMSGKKSGWIDGIVIFLLMFLVMTSIPLVQHRLNRLLKRCP